MSAVLKGWKKKSFVETPGMVFLQGDQSEVVRAEMNLFSKSGSNI